MNTIEAGLNTTLQRLEFNNSYNSLLRYLMPSCEEFILECSLQEGQNINGSTCCEEFFNPEPILNQHGNDFLNFRISITLDLIKYEQCFATNKIIFIFIFKGACFTTNGAKSRHKVKGAGEGNALTIIVMMEKTSTYNYQIEFTSPELEDSQGVYFAVSSDNFGIDAALKTQGQSVQPGMFITTFTFHKSYPF